MVETKKKYFIFFLFCFLLPIANFGQKKMDTLLVSGTPKDSTTKNILSQDTTSKKYIPRVATLRSALIPGWGQAYNKKYWKIPIIYGALGTTAGIFFYNLKTYKILRQTYIYLTTDTANRNKIDPQYVGFSPESIRKGRNSFRQNIDYSVLFFIGFWAINVVDATVDAHLKSFDVNDNISFKVKPGFNLLTRSPTVGLAFNFHTFHQKATTQ